MAAICSFEFLLVYTHHTPVCNAGEKQWENHVGKFGTLVCSGLEGKRFLDDIEVVNYLRVRNVLILSTQGENPMI